MAQLLCSAQVWVPLTILAPKPESIDPGLVVSRPLESSPDLGVRGFCFKTFWLPRAPVEKVFLQNT